jgi:hypothetical protein
VGYMEGVGGGGAWKGLPADGLAFDPLTESNEVRREVASATGVFRNAPAGRNPYQTM